MRLGIDKEEVIPRKWIGLNRIYGISSDMTEEVVMPDDLVFHCNTALCQRTKHKNLSLNQVIIPHWKWTSVTAIVI